MEDGQPHPGFQSLRRDGYRLRVRLDGKARFAAGFIDVAEKLVALRGRRRHGGHLLSLELRVFEVAAVDKLEDSVCCSLRTARNSLALTSGGLRPLYVCNGAEKQQAPED